MNSKKLMLVHSITFDKVTDRHTKVLKYEIQIGHIERHNDRYILEMNYKKRIWFSLKNAKYIVHYIVMASNLSPIRYREIGHGIKATNFRNYKIID